MADIRRGDKGGTGEGEGINSIHEKAMKSADGFLSAIESADVKHSKAAGSRKSDPTLRPEILRGEE